MREAFERLGRCLRRAWCCVRASTRPPRWDRRTSRYFVNAAAGLLTQLSARELLDGLLGIEADMGRKRQERWGPRVIDLDLIWMLGRDSRRAGLDAAAPRSVDAQLRPVSFGGYRPDACDSGTRQRVGTAAEVPATSDISVLE